MAFIPWADWRVMCLVAACVTQVACTTTAGSPPAGQVRPPSAVGASGTTTPAGAQPQAVDLLQVSAECKAANLTPMAPLPVGALTEAVLRKAQTGWVAVRYDVAAGRAQNLQVVSSNPPGLYDEAVLRHARAYTEPTGANVQGCIMTTHIRF